MKSTLKVLFLSSALGAMALPALADDLVVGLATAQTGTLAPYDQPSLKGLQMAVDEINAGGGIAGKFPIKLIAKDTRSDAGQTALVAQELVDQGISILITPCDADPSIAAGQITQAAHIPAFSFCATTPTMPLAVGDYMFGNYPADNVQAAVLAAYAKDKGFKKAYILKSPDTAYTLKLPEYFATSFKAKGGELVGEGTFSMGQQDFSAEVTKIKALNPAPDVIMTAAYEPDFPAFIRQLRGAGVTTPILGSDGIDSPTTFGLGALVDGVVFTTAGFAVDGSPLAGFNAKYKAKFGQDPDTVYIANGYDLGKVIEAAVTKAGSVEPTAIRDAVASLQGVQGVTGAITYAGTKGMPLRSVSLVRIDGGKRSLVSQGVPNAADVPAP
ncbi:MULTISPECIES: ABC transporter substrate-binding protein [unclassified Rhizobium]|jgi:branched-chain amino acid transport system substrate-binding protein|uniref:ABC transporter substrate-binding protein n=1 Tax=unclassified Rhizobium TaxID=2613769 RepID=UPI0006459FB3|nr:MULTISPECIES: ABC transporter substrate-binding protein [unclassified Rhizobium]MBN8954498.1 ABC transporter substrate-binding protein [Rhizobium tropici]OJY66721.1 MAG: ABC transporter substrate-binding protein [Rhizobium sp. 60-20]RKD72757.1 amino acid/amide ABC transporter substrate-binding protein (HAAT family) [Rhizobium sp. WW_1]